MRRQDFIRKINDEAENSLNATLDNMPIGVIRFNSETFEPEWFNPFIDMIFKGNDKVINRDDIKKILKNASDDQYITLGKQKYVAELDSDKNLIYLIDATKKLLLNQNLMTVVRLLVRFLLTIMMMLQI